MDLNSLNLLSKKLRINIIKSSHIKQKFRILVLVCLVLIFLSYLYENEIRIYPNDPFSPNRDRLILSKGHAAPALFQILALKNLINKDTISKIGSNGSYLHEHPPKPGTIPGIEAATGSLGHGLPIALGIAKAAKIQKNI